MALLQKGYLGATPLFRDVSWFEGGAFKQVNAPAATTLTANSSAHTKGAWSEIIASTSADSSLLFFNVRAISASGANTATLLDIGTGASGSETAVVQNIAVGSASNTTVGVGIYIACPLKIPIGTRVAARIQSVVTGGKTAVIQPWFIDGGNYADAPTTVDVIGASTANSQGTSFTAASGAWTEAIASTAQAYRGVALVLSAHNTTTFNESNVVFSVGIGAAGSEVEIGNQYHSYTNAEASISQLPYYATYGYPIPAGSRLAVKHGLSDPTPSKYGFTLIGIP
jgi:hypothetical protein